MNPRTLGLAVAVAASVLVLPAGSAHATAPACTSTFKASSGSFEDASAWTPAAVPTATDVVCWGAGVTVTASASHTVKTVLGGSLVVSGGATLTVGGATDDSTLDSLSLTGGSLTGATGRTLTVAQDITWSGAGTLSTITLAQAAGHTLTISGDATETVAGTAAISTQSPITVDGPGLSATGASTVTTTGTLTLGPGVSLPSTSANAAATFTAASIPSNTGTYGVGAAILRLTSGTTTVADGTTLTLGGGATLATVSDVLAGATLDLPGTGSLAGFKNGGTYPSMYVHGTLRGTGDLGTVADPFGGFAVASGGTIDPGEGGVGTLNFHVGVIGFQDGSTFKEDIAGPTSFDKLTNTGNIFFEGETAVTLLGGYDPADGVTFDVVTGSSGCDNGQDVTPASRFTGRTISGGYELTSTVTAVTSSPTPSPTGGTAPTSAAPTSAAPTSAAPTTAAATTTPATVSALAVISGIAPRPAALTVGVVLKATPGITASTFTVTCVGLTGQPTGSATGRSPVVVPKLVNNTNYSCTAVAHTSGGDTAASAAVPGRPGRLPAVTLKAGKRSYKPGMKITFTGVATVADKPASKRPLILTFRADGSKTRVQVARTTTDSKGRFHFSVTFKNKGAYQARLTIGPATVYNKELLIKRAV